LNLSIFFTNFFYSFELGFDLRPLDPLTFATYKTWSSTTIVSLWLMNISSNKQTIKLSIACIFGIKQYYFETIIWKANKVHMIFVMIFVFEMTFTSMLLITFAILLMVVRWLVISYFMVIWYIKNLMHENMQILLSILFMDIVEMLSHMMGYHSMDDLSKVLCVNAI
jgi:hypothetical protein